MSFVTAIYATALVLSLTLVSVMAWTALRSYLRFRGKMLVTCPETAAPTAVEVNAAHAALARPVVGPSLRLKDCSRWPERRDCGQECLAQIEAAPQQCLVRNILAEWYREKSCVLCGKALGEMSWIEHRPALLGPDRVTLEWREISAQNLPEILVTHWPVCWNCHVAEAFRRRHPHAVIDRPWKPGESHRIR